MVSLRKSRLDQLVEKKKRGARAVADLRARPERFLATVQIGITVVGATAAAFGGATLAEDLAPLLARLRFVGDGADELALVLVIVLVSYLSLVLGELVPKSLALKSTEGYALLMGRPLMGLSWLARPVVWLLTASSNLVLRPFGDRTTFTEARFSPEEIQQIVEEATIAGSLDSDTGAIAQRAIEFGSLTAGDVMVPRDRINALRLDASVEDLRRELVTKAQTRIPVYEENLDKVVGYVAASDILAEYLKKGSARPAELLHPALFVPETMPASKVLHRLRTRQMGLAIVVDEHGGVAGQITVEDLLEELVGEILQEREVPEEMIERVEDGSALVRGDAPIRDVNRELGLDLNDEGEWTTLAGLCIAMADRIPQKGTRLETPDGTVLEVVDATPRRVLWVRISGPQPPASPPEP